MDIDTFSIITNNLIEKNISIKDAKVIELNDGSCIYNFYADMPNGDAYDIENKIESLIEKLSWSFKKKQIIKKKIQTSKKIEKLYNKNKSEFPC